MGPPAFLSRFRQRHLPAGATSSAMRKKSIDGGEFGASRSRLAVDQVPAEKRSADMWRPSVSSCVSTAASGSGLQASPSKKTLRPTVVPLRRDSPRPAKVGAWDSPQTPGSPGMTEPSTAQSMSTSRAGFSKRQGMGAGMGQGVGQLSPVKGAGVRSVSKRKSTGTVARPEPARAQLAQSYGAGQMAKKEVEVEHTGVQEWFAADYLQLAQVSDVVDTEESCLTLLRAPLKPSKEVSSGSLPQAAEELLGAMSLQGILGKGSQGTVALGAVKSCKLACKFAKDKCGNSLEVEADLLRGLAHSSVLKGLAYYKSVDTSVLDLDDAQVDDETDRAGADQLEAVLYAPCMLLLEYVPGRSLQAMLRQRGRLGTARSEALAASLLAALSYMASLADPILHRDIKPANILVDQTSRQNSWHRVVLADFGLACRQSDTERLQMRCGSRGFVAPEIVNGAYQTPKVDMFSLGALLHQTLSGREAFGHHAEPDTWARNCYAQVLWKPAVYWESHMEEKSKLSSMMTLDPADRVSADEALTWFEHDDEVVSAGSGSEAGLAFRTNSQPLPARRCCADPNFLPERAFSDRTAAAC